MKRNRIKGDLSIRNTTIIVFLLIMLVSITSTGFSVFSNWLTSAEDTTERIAVTINEHIYDKISGFLHEPGHIIDVNYHIIQNGIINFANEEERDRFFVGVIDAHDQEIYNFTFGTVNGEYYGAPGTKAGS